MTNLTVMATHSKNVANRKQQSMASPIASHIPCLTYIADPIPHRYMDTRHGGVRIRRHNTSP